MFVVGTNIALCSNQAGNFSFFLFRTILVNVTLEAYEILNDGA